MERIKTVLARFQGLNRNMLTTSELPKIKVRKMLFLRARATAERPSPPPAGTSLLRNASDVGTLTLQILILAGLS